MSFGHLGMKVAFLVLQHNDAVCIEAHEIASEILVFKELLVANFYTLHSSHGRQISL